MAIAVQTSGELSFESAGPGDEAFLVDQFVGARPHLLLTGLDGMALRQLIEMQRRAQQLSFATTWPDHRSEVVYRDGERVAMLVRADTATRTRILDLAVAPAMRGEGIGTAVLRSVIDSSVVPVELSVAIGSPAERLYTRLGFAEVERSDTDVIMRTPVPRGSST